MGNYAAFFIFAPFKELIKSNTVQAEATEQPCCIRLTLTRDFLKWVYSHRLLYGVGEFQDQLWANKPEVEHFSFGGKPGTQFKSLDDAISFNIAFDAILLKHNINEKHKHSLLYLIIFLNFDYEQQSIENNRHNHLHDFAIFILDLIADSLAHIERMRKNENYQQMYDGATNEFFFAKKELVNTMPLEELVEYVPDAKHADDIVKYLRIGLYEQELYVPKDIIITVQSNQSRNLKSLSGKQVSKLELPKNLLYETFTYMISNMLNQHKRYNTWFYQEIIKANSTLADFKKLNDKFKKHTISNTKSLAKVGILVSDYLIKHKIYTSKRAIASFLFDYFALFKAINLKKPIEFPDDYSELISFYNRNGVDSETIRNMMKDVGEI
ncbi:hypothetical protein HDF19_08410 [Mucilaginibacter sp. E4BP6]|uniref:hypothetical protein n=1 Tax=Mucilaginibacter sp. E4BP6 TaxID=2723089 RepID=UPI0015CCD099|nr:hypothetical protein [Mucilaginibacter sp. E4BP6]NYE68607.1 hypothetical protein [Mucilaginibacter sp. E4BP6]